MSRYGAGPPTEDYGENDMWIIERGSRESIRNVSEKYRRVGGAGDRQADRERKAAGIVREIAPATR